MSAHQQPPGSQVPVYRSLYEPLLLGGGPRDFVVCLWLGAFILSAKWGLRGLPLLLLAALVIHIAVACGTKYDPEFVHVLARSLQSPRRLDP